MRGVGHEREVGDGQKEAADGQADFTTALANGQQADGVARWYPEHTEILDADLLHAVEVMNGPLNLDYHVHAGDHRPVTLVFARE